MIELAILPAPDEAVPAAVTPSGRRSTSPATRFWGVVTRRARSASGSLRHRVPLDKAIIDGKKEPIMGIELVPLCTMVAELADPVVLTNTPAGTRVIVDVKSFTVEGDRLRARGRGAGADWLTIGPDGTGTLDVRATMETDDGVLIYTYYQGRRDFSEGMEAPLYTAPKFEVGDERYGWLNKIQAVGKGMLDGSTLTYEIYELR
jgi:Protein of unknown function (DUF3237)